MKRLAKRAAIGFTLFAAVFTALMLSPRSMARPLLSVYAASSSSLLGRIGDDGRATIRLIDPGDTQYDSTLKLVNRAKGTQGEWKINARSLWFRPAAFLIALAVATPLPWARRIWWTAVGLLIVTGYSYARLWLLIVLRFSEPTPIRLFDPPPWAMTALERMYAFLVDSQTGWTVVVVPIWALTAFRALVREEGVARRESKPQPTPSPAVVNTRGQ